MAGSAGRRGAGFRLVGHSRRTLRGRKLVGSLPTVASDGSGGNVGTGGKTSLVVREQIRQPEGLKKTVEVGNSLAANKFTS